MKKIDAFIIGSYKAGTTSLKNYLSEHLDIISHPQLELDSFFEGMYSENEVLHKMKKQFQLEKASQLILAKNTSFYRNEKVLHNIKEYNKESKIIFIVRNPAERAYSSWKMEKERVDIDESFEDIFNAIEKENDSFMFKSCYVAGLYGKYYKNILKIFKEENVMLIKYEELIKNPLKICKECFKFLGVSDDFNPNVGVIHNKSYKTKSRILTGFIKKMSSKNNVLKKIARVVLPYKTFVKIKSNLRKINQSKSTFPPLTEETKSRLLTKYLNDILLLESLSGLTFDDYKNHNE